MIRLRPSGVDEILIKRVQDWYEPGPGVFIQSLTASFSPAMLFTGSTTGAWYDPSDLTTLYRDAAGTQPVTAVEQPVGLMLDKSKGLVLGPELVTNGDFSAGTTGWGVDSGWVIQNNRAEFTQTGTGNRNVYGIPPNTFAVAGRNYKIEFDVISGSGFRGYVGDTLGPVSGGAGTRYSAIITPKANGNVLINGGSATSGSIDNISVRELPGNHAFNSSGNSANFPVLSARVNLLTKTEDFDDAVWVKTNSTVTPNSTAAPDGTTTADTFLDVSGGAYAEIKQSGVEIVSGASYRYSIRAKKGTRRYVYISLSTSRFPAATEAIFDLETASVKSSGAGASTVTATIDSEGFVVCGFTATAISSGSCDLYVYHVNTAGTSILYTGTGAGSIYIWGADLRVANDALNQPAYQRVNTSTDYDTVGFKPYLRFNGTNQWLQTNSIDFTYGDKMFVSAGVRKLSDAGIGMVAELGSAYNTPGSFYFATPSSGSNFEFSSYGNAQIKRVVSTSAAPNTFIASASTDFSQSVPSNALTTRLNGASATGAFTGSATSGTYGNNVLNLGARAGSSLWFNGRLYGMVVAGKQASAAEITSTETYINQKTGAY